MLPCYRTTRSLNPKACPEQNYQKKSSHGGVRKGAGRKKGSANKRTKDIADKAIEEGVTPLEVLLQIMRVL